MFSLKFTLLAVTCVVAVSAYGPPKKSALPPSPGKYDTVGSIGEKDYKKGQDDVLYVKGQPVEGGKEENIDDTEYGGKYGNDKVKEVKAEESGFDLGPAGDEYGGKPVGGKGHGKAYGGKSYSKEVKEVKYDAVDEKADDYGPEEVKEETKYDGGYGGGKKVEKNGKGGYGYGGHKKEIVKEEVIKETGYDVAPEKDSEGGYLPEAPKGGYGPVVPSPKESYGGFAPKGNKGGYGGEEKYEETVKEVGGKFGKEEAGYGVEGPKGGYGGSGAKGFGEEKIEETYKSGVAKGEGQIYNQKGYGEEKIEENIKEGGAYGGPKGGYGGKGGFVEEKVEETVKEGGYGAEKPYGPKGGYGSGPKGGFGEEKIEETIKEGGEYGGKGGYGKPVVPEKNFGYETKIKTTKYGGGYGGDLGGYGPKPGGSITTMSTQSCNKLMDGLLGKLQHSFTSHMTSYKVDKVTPVSIGSWARVRLYDGKFDKVGQICRGGDFQVLPQGENIVIRGTIMVPEPKAKFCGDAYLYNRLKVRNRNLALCAKDASFRVQMIVNKKIGKIDVDELEPVSINGFHIEDDKGLRAENLAWPFNKIHNHQLGKQKYQFMSTLQHKLCDDFRQIIARPEIKKEIIQLV